MILMAGKASRVMSGYRLFGQAASVASQAQKLQLGVATLDG